ncbi:MAG TPA: phospholipase D-like domain-containing protein [Candidatus Limnocylindria bacterium]|nr:phospholipase D-like domain-containing protein [Candidatus Limnocylindria bacterium]
MRGLATVIALGVVLAGCTLTRPQYASPDVRIGEPAFVRTLEAHTLGGLVDGNRVDVLLNGDQIFPAMLAAIRGATTTITFANFIYEEGAIAEEMAEALAERCRAGVGVNILLDAVGSGGIPEPLRERWRSAGCHFELFRPLNPFAIRRLNYRNHRRVLVVDGRIGFTGGTGVGEKWTGDGRRAGYWRQTDVRAEGPIVRFLQAAFAENWRDTTGMLLGGDAYFPPPERRGDVAAQSVKSSGASGAAEAYLLFHLAVDSARSSILITNPYYVPDDSLAEAIARAARRGVDVSVITAGAVGTTLDRLVRQASRAHFGRVLEAGVKIYEYGPALMHAKTMVVDGQWVSIGSANLDNRSFALNDELNLTFMDRGLAARMTEIFREDLKHTKQVDYDEWRRHWFRNLFYLPLIPLRDQL